MKAFRVAVDFDGTIVLHKYPEVGEDVPGAVEWLKKWQEAGAELYLWTMRDSNYLADAVEWFKKNDIILAGVNDASDTWTTSRKLYAHVYVDDAGVCVPLIFPRDGSRGYIDFSRVGPKVLEQIRIYQLTN
jgi:ribonucleotide monophosphatase NagD (HAD superfamily)